MAGAWAHGALAPYDVVHSTSTKPRVARTVALAALCVAALLATVFLVAPEAGPSDLASMPPSRRMGATPEMLYEALQQPSSSPTMLSDSGAATTALQSEAFQPDSKVCEKHSWIDEKLQALLDRLDDEEGKLLESVTDGEFNEKATHKAYMDAVEAHEDAKLKKKRAGRRKDDADVKITETDAALKMAKGEKRDSESKLRLELSYLNADVELIKELIALIDELHAVKPETKGKAAVLQQQFMDKARRLASRLSTPKLREQTLAAVTSLAEYKESNEVRAVLEELLNESTTRMGEINEQLAQLDANIEAAKAAHKKAQEDLAAAIDDHDKATRELHNHDPLEIARLKGIWQQAKISLEQARTRYGTDRKRFQREREIIGRIMAKIDANCAGAPTPESLSPTNSFMGMGAFNPDYKKSIEAHTFIMALEWNGQPFTKEGKGFPALLDWGRVPNERSEQARDFTERWQFEMNQAYAPATETDISQYIGPYTMTFGAPQVDNTESEARTTGKKLSLKMPEHPTFMVIAGKWIPSPAGTMKATHFSGPGARVEYAVGFYQIYVSTPQGTVWQVLKDVRINQYGHGFFSGFNHWWNRAYKFQEYPWANALLSIGTPQFLRRNGLPIRMRRNDMFTGDGQEFLRRTRPFEQATVYETQFFSEALDSGLVAFQIEALSKKYAKNSASLVSTESRASFDKVDMSVGGVTTTATQNTATTNENVKKMSETRLATGGRRGERQ